MVAWVVLVLIFALIAVVSVPISLRLGTPPGVQRSEQATKRVWIGVTVMCTVSLLGVGSLSWAIKHHHGAVGVLVLVGVYFGSSAVVFMLRYRRHRRRISKG
jgi:hypothetical protein